MENTFWQVNFWGIVGTTTGAIGLLISWLNWKYSHPKIKITQTTLSMRKFDDKFLRAEKDTDPETLRRNSLSIQLDIKLANERGGPGAIEKPVLVFKVNKFFWQRPDYIEIEPITKSYSSTKLSENSYETETVNLGKSYNLKGGEIIDDELKYSVHGSDGDLQRLIKNYDNGYFYIRYLTNTGTRHERKLKLTLH